MAKVVAAICVGGVVTADGVAVPGVQILSQGVGSSLGFLVLDEERKYYVAKTSPDLDATLTQVISGLTAAASGLTAIAAIADPITGPPAVVGPVASITAAVAALTALKGLLK